jgi:hypothetical protein
MSRKPVGKAAIAGALVGGVLGMFGWSLAWLHEDFWRWWEVFPELILGRDGFGGIVAFFFGTGMLCAGVLGAGIGERVGRWFVRE